MTCIITFAPVSYTMQSACIILSKACGELLLVPQCPKYFYHTCLSCFVYTVHSQCIPSGSCCILNFSRSLLNIPSRPLSGIHPAWNKNSLFKLLPRQCQHIRSTGAEVEQRANPSRFLCAAPPSAPHNSNLTMDLGQAHRSLVAVPSVYHCSIYPDDSDTHVEWKFPRAEEYRKGVAKNYTSLSYAELGRIHQIPFVLGLPTDAPVIVIPWNNGGFLFITVLPWCFEAVALYLWHTTALLPYLPKWLPCFYFVFPSCFNQI